MSRKIIIDSPEGREIFEVFDSSTLVGRADDCDLKLEGDKVSRKHCRLLLLGGELLVEDLGASNGTFVNGQRLADRQLLESGATVEVGEHKLHVDRAPLARPVAAAADVADDGREGPPSSRRLAADRKQKNNALPIVIGCSALLLVFLFIKLPGDGSGESASSKAAKDLARLEAAKDETNTSLTTTKDEVETRQTTTAVSAEERERIEARSRALEDLNFEVNQNLIQSDYGRALAAIERFEKQHGKAGPALYKQVDDGMAQALATTVGDYQKHLADNREDLALALLRDRLNRFPVGSSQRNDVERMLSRGALGMDPAGVTAAAKSNPDQPKSGTTAVKIPQRAPVAAKLAADQAVRDAERDRYFALANDAEILLGQRRYETAAFRFREAAEAAAKSGLEDILMTPVMRKMRQSERLRDFVVAIESVAKERGEDLGQIPFLSGRKGAVRSATEEGFVFEDDEGEMVISARVLRSEALKLMIDRARFEALDRVNAAAYLFTVGEREMAERLLFRSLSDLAALKPEVDSVLADAFAIDLPPGGFVWHDGRFLSPNDVSRVQVRETIDAAIPLVQSTNPAKREEAYASLRALGDRATSAYHRALLDAKSNLFLRSEKMPGFKKLAALDQLRQDLETARESAFELIFDETKYPYPYRGRGNDVLKMYQETQKEIDLRTRVIDDIWRQTLSVRLSPEMREVIAMLAEYNRELDRLELGRGTLDPRYMLYLPTSDTVDIQNYAWSEEERERLDNSAAWVLENNSKQSMAVAAERQQVQITNDYRLMMGRHAVKLNEKLMECARMHSVDMSKGGFFAHDNPLDPKKRTPSDRANFVGFHGVGISENIAMNPGGPMGAHKAWIHSSGHHRNILGKSWRLLGSGNAGSYWTQNFSIREYGESDGGRGIKGDDASPEAPDSPDEDGVH